MTADRGQLEAPTDQRRKDPPWPSIALLVLTPLLGFLAPNRRLALAVLVGMWALIFPFQTHDVLRAADGDLPDELLGTITYFALNYAAVAVAVFTTNWISGRRHGDTMTVGVAR